MRKLKNVQGSGLVVVIIFLALIGVGFWFLFSHKNAMNQEGRAFGREMIQKLAVDHDINFFANNLGPQARLSYPRSRQEEMLAKFNQLGVPAQPIKIEENIQWESHFFAPKGYFTANLNYPAQAAMLQIAFSHPVGKWQLDDLTMTWDKPR